MSPPRVVALPEIERALGTRAAAGDRGGLRRLQRRPRRRPPVGSWSFGASRHVHIKYGYLKEAEHYVKVASGFYENPGLGLPSYDGLMLVFAQATGALQAVLLDEGHLTNLRTAVPGPRPGTSRPHASSGLPCSVPAARRVFSLQQLAGVTDCRDVGVGPAAEAAEAYARELEVDGFGSGLQRPRSGSLRGAAVTTHPAFPAGAVRPGTHITAVGLTRPQAGAARDAACRASRVVADARSQCAERGELAHALAAGLVDIEDELGAVIAGDARPRVARRHHRGRSHGRGRAGHRRHGCCGAL